MAGNRRTWLAARVWSLERCYTQGAGQLPNFSAEFNAIAGFVRRSSGTARAPQ
jgi:hypothetical protein